MPAPNVTPTVESNPDAGAVASTSEPSISTSGDDDPDDFADLAKAVVVIPHNTSAASVIRMNFFIFTLLSDFVRPMKASDATAMTKNRELVIYNYLSQPLMFCLKASPPRLPTTV